MNGTLGRDEVRARPSKRLHGLGTGRHRGLAPEEGVAVRGSHLAKGEGARCSQPDGNALVPSQTFDSLNARRKGGGE